MSADYRLSASDHDALRSAALRAYEAKAEDRKRLAELALWYAPGMRVTPGDRDDVARVIGR